MASPDGLQSTRFRDWLKRTNGLDIDHSPLQLSKLPVNGTPDIPSFCHF
ncbi:MAG: hypothetical protein ACTHL3_04860 [Candidatus Nitrosocosmicus sp.]